MLRLRDCRAGRTAPTANHALRLGPYGRRAGFTLVELLVAMTIAAILTAIAVPSYRTYVQRGRLSGAFDTLGTYRMRLEQAYQDTGSYGAEACAVAQPADTTYFRFTCVLTNAGQGFTASAIGIGTMAGYTYSTDAAGTQTTVAFPGGTGLPAACWWSRPGDC